LGTQAMEPKAIEVQPSRRQKYSSIWSVSIRVSNDEQGKNTEVYLITIIFFVNDQFGWKINLLGIKKLEWSLVIKNLIGPKSL
jgi:hypothetical protein